MNKAWRLGLPSCTAAFTVELTGRKPREECTFRRLMAGNGHWASLRWRTRLSSRRWSQSSTRYTRWTFGAFPYGFRPGRSPHQALDALNVGIQRKRVNWILDADIRGFFDHLSHEWMMKFVAHRVADTRILRLIGKWLKAGVSEEGDWTETTAGTPQGAVISPLLANVYLHYVFDLWIEVWRQKVASGEVVVVRYADDLVVGFQHRKDAERFLAEFKERLASFALELHPDKTRLIEFGRLAQVTRQRRGEGKAETFTFLGFTHYCTTNSKGYFVVGRTTQPKRMQAALRKIKAVLRERMHERVPVVGQWLKRVV